MMCAAAYGPTPGRASRSAASSSSGSSSRSPAERLEVERRPRRRRPRASGGRRRGSRRGRRRGRRPRRRRPSPRASGRRGRTARPAAAGGRLAEVLDEGPDHPLGGRPGAVRRADRLHDLLEDGRAADEPPGARRRPGELGVGRGDGVEGERSSSSRGRAPTAARTASRLPGAGRRGLAERRAGRPPSAIRPCAAARGAAR